MRVMHVSVFTLWPWNKGSFISFPNNFPEVYAIYISVLFLRCFFLSSEQQRSSRQLNTKEKLWKFTQLISFIFIFLYYVISSPCTLKSWPLSAPGNWICTPPAPTQLCSGLRPTTKPVWRPRRPNSRFQLNMTPLRLLIRMPVSLNTPHPFALFFFLLSSSRSVLWVSYFLNCSLGPVTGLWRFRSGF